MDVLMVGAVAGFFWCLFKFVDLLNRL